MGSSPSTFAFVAEVIGSQLGKVGTRSLAARGGGYARIPLALTI